MKISCESEVSQISTFIILSTELIWQNESFSLKTLGLERYSALAYSWTFLFVLTLSRSLSLGYAGALEKTQFEVNSQFNAHLVA